MARALFRVLLYSAAFVAVVFLASSVLSLGGVEERYAEEIAAVDRQRSVIEEFRKRVGAYPPNGCLRDRSLFYERLKDGYVVGFEVNWERAYWYDSRVGGWSYERNYQEREKSLGVSTELEGAALPVEECERLGLKMERD